VLYLHSFWRNVSICFPHCSTKFSMTLSFPELNVGVSKALRLFHCCPFMLINIFSKYGVSLMLIVGWSTKCWKSRTIICLMSSGSSTISLGRRPSKRPATVYWRVFTRLSIGLFFKLLSNVYSSFFTFFHESTKCVLDYTGWCKGHLTLDV